MKKYRVWLRRKVSGDVTVEAQSEEQAKHMVLNLSPIEWSDEEHVEVELVQEVDEDEDVEDEEIEHEHADCDDTDCGCKDD